MLKEIISAVEQQLANEGLKRSQRNFTLESIPATAANHTYTLGELSVVPSYHPGSLVQYNRIEFTLLVLCHVFGSHNQSATAAEGYLTSLEVFELIENIVVAGQTGTNGEELSIASATLQPHLVGKNEEYLVWRFRLNVEASRSMT